MEPTIQEWDRNKETQPWFHVHAATFLPEGSRQSRQNRTDTLTGTKEPRPWFCKRMATFLPEESEQSQSHQNKTERSTEPRIPNHGSAHTRTHFCTKHPGQSRSRSLDISSTHAHNHIFARRDPNETHDKTGPGGHPDKGDLTIVPRTWPCFCPKGSRRSQ